MEIQKFDIEINGEKKVAELLKIITLDEKNYALYSVQVDEENSDVFVSEVITDEDGNDTLKEINDPKIKENVIEFANIIFS